jgi:hypothetical protein
MQDLDCSCRSCRMRLTESHPELCARTWFAWRDEARRFAAENRRSTLRQLLQAAPPPSRVLYYYDSLSRTVELGEILLACTGSSQPFCCSSYGLFLRLAASQPGCGPTTAPGRTRSLQSPRLNPHTQACPCTCARARAWAASRSARGASPSHQNLGSSCKSS